MKLVVTIILIAIAGILYFSYSQSDHANQPTFYADNEALNITVPSAIQTPESTPKKIKVNKQAHTLHTNNYQESTSDVSNRSALTSLPLAMQQQVKELSGRSHKNIQPIEVEPGVFMIPAGKGVQVVSVAVMNEDGTLSISEH